MELEKFLNENNIPFEKDMSLRKLTGMNQAGTIPLVAKPNCINQLVDLYRVVNPSYSYEILGGLTNTYIAEGIKRDIIIVTTKVKDVKRQKGQIVVGCGYSLTKIASELSKEGLTGYEGLVGIPGTVGAAAINNSGAFSSEMSNVVREVQIINKVGEICTISNKDLKYAVRTSCLKQHDFGVLLSVSLQTSDYGDQEEIDKRIKCNKDIRQKSIDGNRKSLGSIIKGDTVQRIWEEHPLLSIIRKCIYAPFKYTKYRKRAQCFSEFFVLRGLRFYKHSDNIGRFCWTTITTEKDFFDYLAFLKKVSNNRITLEIEIKK